MDKNIINALSNFGAAIELLVDELKKKNSEDKKTEDVFSDMLSGSGTSLSDIKKSLDDIKNDTSQIIQNQKTLIDLSKQNRQKEETGLFDKSGDKKQIEKITEGVGTIILIAGAVLAIGMAFKLVSPVDLGSVIALGAAITAFGFMIAQLKESGIPSPLESLNIGLSILAVTTAAVAASYLISGMANISGAQLLTFVAISATFGIMFKMGLDETLVAISKISLDDVFYLPLILTGISLAVVASSLVLQFTQPLDYGLLLNIVAIGAALGLMALVMSIPLFIIGKMGGSVVKGALLSVLILPAISLAVALSSWILGIGNYDSPIPLGWVMTFGLAMMIMVPLVGLLGLIPLPLILMGALSLVIVSAAMVAASFILSNINTDFLLKISDSFAYFIDVVGASIVKFAQNILPVIIDAAAAFLNKVGPQLGQFLRDVLPPIGDFLSKLINDILPAVESIIDTVLSNVVPAISDIFGEIANIIDKATDIFPKVGKAFESIGEGIAKPLRVIESIITSVGNAIVNIIRETVNGIKTLTELDPSQLENIGAGLDVISKAISSLTGGFGDVFLDLISGGKQDPLTRILSSISKYAGDVVPVGNSIASLASGIERLNEIDIDDNQINRALSVVEKINNMSGKANIEMVNKQIVDTGDLIQELKELGTDDNEELLNEMRIMNQQLAQLVTNSSNISSQLNDLREDKEPNLDL
jgi:hypothetical protein